MPGFGAWCIYRDGDICTNPKSPVNTSSERRVLPAIVIYTVGHLLGFW